MIQDLKKIKIPIFNVNPNCIEWYVEYYHLFPITVVLI